MKAKIARHKASISEMGLRDKKYLLFVGSLTKLEGAHYLIEAFKQLEDTAKTPNNFKLAIVANGAGGDDEDYVKFLHTISAKRDNIKFLCATKKSSLKQLFSGAYLYVQPCEKALPEGALVQAMKLGLAILVSDVKENLEIIGSGGFVFKTKSVLDLRDRLAYLLSRREEVALMGERVKKLAVKYSRTAAVIDRKNENSKKITSEKNLWNWKNLLKKA